MTRTIKIVGLVVGVAAAAIVVFQLLVFGRKAGGILLATLQSTERTTLHNEAIAASFEAARPGERIVAVDANLNAVLRETALTMQALRASLAETTATIRSTRQATVELTATAKAARTSIEGAKLPDVEPALRQTNELLGESTRLVNRLDTILADSDLANTLQTTGRIARNVERDQGNISTIVANTVPVSEGVKNTTIAVERKIGYVRRFFRWLL